MTEEQKSKIRKLIFQFLADVNEVIYEVPKPEPYRWQKGGIVTGNSFMDTHRMNRFEDEINLKGH